MSVEDHSFLLLADLSELIVQLSLVEKTAKAAKRADIASMAADQMHWAQGQVRVLCLSLTFEVPETDRET